MLNLSRSSHVTRNMQLPAAPVRPPRRLIKPYADPDRRPMASREGYVLQDDIDKEIQFQESEAGLSLEGIAYGFPCRVPRALNVLIPCPPRSNSAAV